MERKILIIDDNVDFADSIKIILESANYKVDVANSVDEADKKLKDNVPDMIVLDVIMQKGAEGIIFSRKLKKDSRLNKVPVIMLTSMTKQTGFKFVEKDPRNPVFLPVDEFLEKPVAPGVLLDKVKKLLEKKVPS
jgi:DNA-binding response OmpR family regulator